MTRKLIPAAWLLFVAGAASAQSNQEAQVLTLSNTIFRWEISNQVDSLVEVFDQKLMVVNATGDIQRRVQYLTALRSGSFVHNAIAIEENIATVENNTATVVGKGQFTVTLSGTTLSLHLAYMEVFTKSKKHWKLLAIHFSLLPN